jgi:hypothetical protein
MPPIYEQYPAIVEREYQMGMFVPELGFDDRALPQLADDSQLFVDGLVRHLVFSIREDAWPSGKNLPSGS